jgi:hypothetical protein
VRRRRCSRGCPSPSLVGPGPLLGLTFAIGVGSALSPCLRSDPPELVRRDQPRFAERHLDERGARGRPALGGFVIAAAGAGATFAEAVSFLP